MPELELSEREREILRLVATGASNKEIALQLYISPNTVKVHLKNIFTKIGVASRTEAAMAAVQMGLVPAVAGPGAAATNVPLPQNTLLEATGAANGQAAFPNQAAGRSRSLVHWRPSTLFAALALLLVLSAIGLLIWAGQFSPQQAQASPSPPVELPRWQVKTALPTARTGLAVAAFENQVYAIGGETDQGVTGQVERYDPESGVWITLSAKPRPVVDASAAVIGGLIYVPGGRLNDDELTDILEVYDPFRDRWEERARLPLAVSAYALTAFEGRLYLFGGWDGRNELKTVYEYDPAQDAWKAMTAMPTARAYAGAAAAGGRIYVIGGADGRKALAVNEAYQPALENTGEQPWFKMKAMPGGRYAMGIAGLADIVHIVGGLGAGSLPPLKYFPQVDDWQALEGENTAVLKDWSHLQLAPVQTNIYALGGLHEQQPSSRNLAYQAIYTIVIPFPGIEP